MDQSNVKLPYESPALIVYGSMEALTQAGKLTGGLDGNYPIGTPNDPPGIFS